MRGASVSGMFETVACAAGCLGGAGSWSTVLTDIKRLCFALDQPYRSQQPIRTVPDTLGKLDSGGAVVREHKIRTFREWAYNSRLHALTETLRKTDVQREPDRGRQARNETGTRARCRMYKQTVKDSRKGPADL